MNRKREKIKIKQEREREIIQRDSGRERETAGVL